MTLQTLPGRVVARRGLSFGFWIWLAAGLVLVLCAVVSGETEFAWLGAFPCVLAVSLKIFGEPRFEMELSETSLSVNAGPPIPFDSIQRVKALTAAKAHEPASFPILVRHASGFFVIPAKLSVASGELLSFLRARAPAHVLQLDPRLTDYLVKQEQIYGSRVALFVGESVPEETRRWSVAKATLFTALVCSVLGFGFYGSGVGKDGALILGIISSVTLIVVGLVTLLVYARSRGARGVETAGLVISPAGLAMIQGDLVGELRWEEIRRMKLARGAVALGRTKAYQGQCIQLFVAGAVVSIADLYHEPVSHIYSEIERLRLG